MLKIHNTALSPPNLIMRGKKYFRIYPARPLKPQGSVDHALRATSVDNRFRKVLSDVIINSNVT